MLSIQIRAAADLLYQSQLEAFWCIHCQWQSTERLFTMKPCVYVLPKGAHFYDNVSDENLNLVTVY